MENIQEFICSYVKKHSIPLKRDNPREYTFRLVKIFTIFTLPLAPDSLMADSLKTKCLYGLWNSMIDDRIDCDQEGRDDLIDTINVIWECFSRKEMHSETVTGHIMKSFLDLFLAFPAGPNSDTAEEFLLLDLLRTTNAFNHERIASTMDNIVTLAEYMEFSASTIDVRPLLDIDLALIQKKIDPFTIGMLREMYKLIGMAFRLSNDLATLEREFYSEKSPNSVILYGIENGVLPLDVLHMSDEDKKGIYEREIPLLYKNIEDQIEYCKQEIFSKASCITKIDVNPIMKQFDLLVERASSDSHVTHS
jgi:hypothetical protein